MPGDHGHRVRGLARERSAVLSQACTLIALGVILFACRRSGDVTGPSSPPLSYLELFPARLAAAVGEGITLNVIARDLTGADVSNVVPVYTSSSPGVVRIDPGGNILANGAGTATVRASAGGQIAETVIHVGPATYDLAALGPPRVLDANYIDLSKIERISRFRSAIGHGYTNGTGDETCRSMKHYFQPKLSVDWTTVDVYAPASGTIFVIRPDGAFGFQILLKPRDLPVLYVAIFHVQLDPRIVRGTWVNAGDHVGRHASSRTMSDIAMSIGPTEGGTLISYFEAMTDAVFAQYQARGVPSREAAIITRAERDADPVPCVGEGQFTTQGTLPNWLVLN